MEGLEVKVAFGSVWKETLTELSGGQRSLLALSLILSLLLFKPGELYATVEIGDLGTRRLLFDRLQSPPVGDLFLALAIRAQGAFRSRRVRQIS